MSCCSGENQTKEFDVTLYWRSSPEIEHRLLFSISGVDGKWSGPGSADYDLSPVVYQCDHLDIKGSNVILRVNLDLICTEIPDKTYVHGTMQFSFGFPGLLSTYHGKLLPTELNCKDGGPKASAEWLLLWLGPLGSCRMYLSAK